MFVTTSLIHTLYFKIKLPVQNLIFIDYNKPNNILLRILKLKCMMPIIKLKNLKTIKNITIFVLDITLKWHQITLKHFEILE